MLILVLNGGSTSLRFSLYDTKYNDILARGSGEGIGTEFSYYKYINNKGITKKLDLPLSNVNDVLVMLCSDIVDKDLGVIKKLSDIDAIGHRIVHGGEKYTQATIINDEVISDIEELSLLAPMHNGKSLSLINECKDLFKNATNVGVFDTAFHSTIPIENYLYAIPRDFYEKYRIRKYGFHGISYNYVLNRYCDITSRNKETTDVVICHLGGGSSICAIKNGKSFDTTMGLTPLSGMMMASRCGSIDPSIVYYALKKMDLSIDELFMILNNDSGYYSISNSKNMQDIVERSLNNDPDAILLRKMIAKDFKSNLLSMMANLPKIDSIVLTGGIGEKNREQREMLLSDLGAFEIRIDNEKNNQCFNTESIISATDSKIPIYVIPADEEKEIASQTSKLLVKRK